MRGFQLEASALGVIRHPNVVTMLDFGLDDRESPCLVLERFSGWTLEQAMRQGAALRLDQKMGIVIQILAALGNAHSLGFVHRSMRPESILLQGDGLAKVMGIDLAPWAVDHREGMLRRAYYVSPEQVRGSTVDSRTDLFCVGCVLFEMLSGRPPFQSDELAPTLFSIVEEEPDYRSLPLGEEHDHLRRILGTALAKDPGDRYQTADRFAAELRLALKNQHTGNEGRKV
jgi:serine/threonine-protein kinase